MSENKNCFDEKGYTPNKPLNTNVPPQDGSGVPPKQPVQDDPNPINCPPPDSGDQEKK